MEDLKNRRIVVVGASSGIGAETAHMLSIFGAKVALLARRKEKLEEVLRGLEGEGHTIHTLDVAEIDGIDSTVQEIVDSFGKIDGLVYAAGKTGDCPLRQLTYQKQWDVFSVNFLPFVECVRQVSRKNRYNDGLRIVAVSSTASLCGSKGHTAYAASKAAMNAAVRCMAKELASKNIYINAVAPGWILTDMSQEYINRNGEDSDTVKNMLTGQYLGMGYPSDVANAICFLLSPTSRFITGTVLPVDGGSLT